MFSNKGNIKYFEQMTLNLFKTEILRVNPYFSLFMF